MVHISLPRGLSSLGKNKDKDHAGNGAGANGDGGGRPSPPRLASNNNSTAALVDQKPLILKVYVIKVLLRRYKTSWASLIMSAGPKPGRERSVWDIRPSTFLVDCPFELWLTVPVSGRHPRQCETIDAFDLKDPQPRMEDMLRHALDGRSSPRMQLLG
jgi:hypothetical protein